MAPCDSVAAGVSCIVFLFLLHCQQTVKKISAPHAVIVCSFSPVSLFLQRERLPAKRKRKRVQCTPVSGKKEMQCAAARSLLFVFSEFGPTLWLHFNAVRFQFGCLQAPARERCQFSNEHELVCGRAWRAVQWCTTCGFFFLQ